MPTESRDPVEPYQATDDLVAEQEEDLLAQPGDAEAPEPLDGRDGQPSVGSSDEPELLDMEDPLNDPLRVADESATLLVDTPLPESPGEDEL